MSGTGIVVPPNPASELPLFNVRAKILFDGSTVQSMSFQLSGEQEAIRSAVREFAEEEIAPVAREHDESGEYPEELRREAAEYDFVAPNIPTEYGGAGWTRCRRRS